MSGARDVIERLTGFTPADADSILREVKANSAKLNACGYHAFVEKPGQGDMVMGKRYVCSVCGGEVDHHAYYWHAKGRRPKS
ncbi:hypothetical protein [Pseudomonas viridiflava]|uniref:hypothetical protein n=1 Tax=Pseudomonas viridiflava TaxID=33069 RepID=UPI002EC0B3AD|nr:hypothetical protein [Pseudomonas viridiflava]